MAGIVFFKTQQIHGLEKFYTQELGMKVWLRQEDCIVLRHENLLLGFCTRPEVERSGTVTLFYRTKEEVDTMYEKLKDNTTAPPVINDKYNIYQFFCCDPENRILEFQCFLHPVDI